MRMLIRLSLSLHNYNESSALLLVENDVIAHHALTSVHVYQCLSRVYNLAPLLRKTRTVSFRLVCYEFYTHFLSHSAVTGYAYHITLFSSLNSTQAVVALSWSLCFFERHFVNALEISIVL